MERIPPSRKIRKEIKELLRGGAAGENLATEYLGREHYKRHGDAPHKGYRNGYEPMNVKTAEGKIQVELPQLRDTAEPFTSRLKPFFRGNTDCLEKLAVEMYARGLSPRDIEDSLLEATGDMMLSRSSVSRVTEVLWEEFGAFRERDLSDYEVEYLFLDAVFESVRKLAGIKEAILVAWGIQKDGRKVLLSMALETGKAMMPGLSF